MRLGTCLPRDAPAQTRGQFDLDRALACLSEAGIRGCLTNFPADEASWEDSSRQLAQSLRAAGIALLEYNTPFFIPAVSTDSCATVAERTVRLLALAESIGCLNVATCVGGPRGILPHPANRTPQAWDVLKQTCDLVAGGAGRLGLRSRLLIEPVYTTVVGSPAELARLVDAVASPHVRGHMDIANCLRFDLIYDHGPFIRDGFRTLGDRIHSAHIKDVAPAQSYFPGLVEQQVGEGVLDLRTYLQCLAALPDDFTVVIEHLSALADIRRAHERILALAAQLHIDTWSTGP